MFQGNLALIYISLENLLSYKDTSSLFEFSFPEETEADFPKQGSELKIATGTSLH